MKQFILTVSLALCFAIPALAQESGRITFEERISFELPVMEGIDSAMLATIPRESKNEKELYFSPEASLYRNAPEKPKDNLEPQSGIVIKMGQNKDVIYADLKEKQLTEQRDFMDRMFLIEKDIKNPEWKLSGKQKTILGYNCQEAIVKQDSSEMKVWFTPQIPVQTGPNAFVGFPGMVLEAEMNDGDYKLVATSLDKGTFDKNLLAKPVEGKKMTEEKFRKMQEEKMKEMQEQYGGNGRVIIRTEH